MRLMTTLTVTLLCITFSYTAPAQIIKYPKKYGLRISESGPKPGSPASDKENTAEFQRIYSYPANLRLLVRTKCGKQPKNQDLIERAKQLTEPSSPVQELDWDNIRDSDKVSYWLVIYSKQEIVNFSLQSKDNKWVVNSKSNKENELWEVKQIVIKNKSCINYETLKKQDLQKAIHDHLIERSLSNYRNKW